MTTMTAASSSPPSSSADVQHMAFTSAAENVLNKCNELGPKPNPNPFFFGSAGSYRKKIVRDISCPMSQSTFHHNHFSLNWRCNIRVGHSTKGNQVKFMDDVTLTVASQKVQGSILWRITSQCYNTSNRRIKCSTFLKDCSKLFRSAGPSATV